MYCYNIAFLTPCQVGSDSLSSDLFAKLWKELIHQLPESRNDKYFTHNELPEPLCKVRKNFFRLLLAPWSLSNQESIGQNSNWNKNEWFDFSEIQNHDLILGYLCKELDNINWDELDYANITAEQLQNCADSLTETSYCLNIYWLTCGHSQCIESSEHTVIHNSLEHLTRRKMASVTFVCNSEIIRTQDFTDLWFKTHVNIHVISQNKKLLQDNKILWQGCLECLQNEEDEESYDWCLSRTTWASSQISETSLSYLCKKDRLPLDMEHCDYVFAHKINVISELPKTAVPVWKILPYQFALYHKSQLQRVLKLQEKAPFEGLIEGKDTLLLSSIETCEKPRHQRPQRTSEDCIEVIPSESRVSHDKKQSKLAVIETHHLVLYAVEPGIFSAYFVRPEDAFIKLSSQLAIYQVLGLFDENVKEKTAVDDDTLERRWLQLLHVTQSCKRSPIRSQSSLAVQLNATEMLKHFTKDGKPMKQELKLLLEQLQERNISPKRQTGIINPKLKDDLVSILSTSCDIQKHHEQKPGVEYCLDDFSNASPSIKLLLEQETQSICTTPRTLANVKRQSVKRGLSIKTETTVSADGIPRSSNDTLQQTNIQLERSTKMFPERDLSRIDIEEFSDGINDQCASNSSTDALEQLEVLGKIRSSIDHTNKEIQPDSSMCKEKRRSYEWNETSRAADDNSSEKRSDRHKRRLARVVKRALIKYGVDVTKGYFTTCSERLYYLCKSFLKDLKTSEGLNKEMKRLAEANVPTVVEFEKRRYRSKSIKKTESSRTANF